MANKIDEILAKHNAEVQRIKGFVDLTDEAKARRLQEARARYQGEFAKAKAERREKVEKKVRESRAAVYRLPTSVTDTDAEKATISAAYWSAWDRVTLVTKDARAGQRDLEELLDKAERVRDPILAAACYHKAMDMGYQGVVDAYLDFRPEEAKKLERYHEAVGELKSVNSAHSLLVDAMTADALS